MTSELGRTLLLSLAKNINMEKKLPKNGDKIYVPSSSYVYRGEGDFIGGIATIEEVITTKTLPPEHNNYCFIKIKERSGVEYNYKYLLKQQEELKEKFGNSLAHPKPDNRIKFNNNNNWKQIK